MTNCKGATPYLYQIVFCVCGGSGNRTSRMTSMAHHFRVLLPAAADVLLPEQRLAARAGDYPRPKIGTPREWLLKLCVSVEHSVRHIVLQFQQPFP